MRTALLLTMALTAAAAVAEENTLTEQEQKDGWKLLFNGKDLTGWKGGKGWIVEDGQIVRADRGGFLWSDEQYEDFILKIEYRFDSRRVNSGVYFRKGKIGGPEHRGIEMQVLSDYGRKPTKNSNGALYDLVKPIKNMTRPSGEWNQAQITAIGAKVSVKLNGTVICRADFDQWTEAGKNPDGSKNKYEIAYKDLARKGHIALQDHGGRVCYRNIKIKLIERGE